MLDPAFLRPRPAGYMGCQENGGPVVHAALRGQLSDAEALARLDALYRQSLAGSAAHLA